MADDGLALSEYLFLVCDDVHNALIDLRDFCEAHSPVSPDTSHSSLLDNLTVDLPVVSNAPANPVCDHLSAPPRAHRNLLNRNTLMPAPSSRRQAPGLHAALHASSARVRTRAREQPPPPPPMAALRERARELFCAVSQPNAPASSPQETTRRRHRRRRGRSHHRHRRHGHREERTPGPESPPSHSTPIAGSMARLARKMCALRERGRAIFGAPGADVPAVRTTRRSSARRSTPRRRATPRSGISDGRAARDEGAHSFAIGCTSLSSSNRRGSSESSPVMDYYSSFDVDSDVALLEDNDCDCGCGYEHRSDIELVVDGGSAFDDRIGSAYSDTASFSSSYGCIADRGSASTDAGAPSDNCSCCSCEGAVRTGGAESQQYLRTPTRTRSGRVFVDTSPLTDCYPESPEDQSEDVFVSSVTEIDAHDVESSLDHVVFLASDDEDDDESWMVQAVIEQAQRELPEGDHSGRNANGNEDPAAVEAAIEEALANSYTPVITQLLDVDLSTDEEREAYEDVIRLSLEQGDVHEEDVSSLIQHLDTDDSSDFSVADTVDLYASDHSEHVALHEFYIAGALSMLNNNEPETQQAEPVAVESDDEVSWRNTMDAILAYDSSDEALATARASDVEARGRNAVSGTNSSRRHALAIRARETNEELPEHMLEEAHSDLWLTLSSDNEVNTLTTLDVSPIADTMSSAQMQEVAPAAVLPPAARASPCVICTDDIGTQLGRILPCAHAFHAECVDTWASHNASCPTCRSPIADEDAAPASLEIDEEMQSGAHHFLHDTVLDGLWTRLNP